MKLKYNALCLECSEEIFNPLCPKCLSKEIEQWLQYQNPKTKKIIKDEIKKILKTELDQDYTKCIICKGKDVFLCPYCFTEKIYNKMKSAKLPMNILKEFLTLFNFDLEQTGYSHDFKEFNDFDDIGNDFY